MKMGDNATKRRGRVKNLICHFLNTAIPIACFFSRYRPNVLRGQ